MRNRELPRLSEQSVVRECASTYTPMAAVASRFSPGPDHHAASPGSRPAGPSLLSLVPDPMKRGLFGLHRCQLPCKRVAAGPKGFKKADATAARSKRVLRAYSFARPGIIWTSLTNPWPMGGKCVARKVAVGIIPNCARRQPNPESSLPAVEFERRLSSGSRSI